MICIALHEILPYLGAFEFVQGNTVHVHACTVHTYMLVHVNTCMHVPYIASTSRMKAPWLLNLQYGIYIPAC